MPKLSKRQRPRRLSSPGFTLVELTISLLVLTVVIVGVLALFDSTNQLAKNQLLRVDLQQSLRVGQREMVRTIRLAGRGGLLLSADNSRLPDQGWALKVDNNVQSSSITTVSGAPGVVDSTDVLTIRGVVNTPVYIIAYLDGASFTLDAANDRGTVVVNNVTPESNHPQDLEPLCDMLTNGANRPEALIMVSAYDDRLFATAEIDYTGSDSSGCPNPTQVTLGFRYDTPNAVNSYTKLSNDGENPGVFPEKFLSTTRVGSVGILEEYRFYLRQTPEGTSKLSRARVYPNTEDAYDNANVNLDNLSVDIAENVIDFQVALAFDPDGDGQIAETPDGIGDHWFGNSDQDKADQAPWTDYLAENAAAFRFVRLTTLARTAEGDKNHSSKELVRLEDRVYGTSDPLNQADDERKYPRIVLRSIVDLRNL